MLDILAGFHWLIIDNELKKIRHAKQTNKLENEYFDINFKRGKYRLFKIDKKKISLVFDLNTYQPRERYRNKTSLTGLKITDAVAGFPFAYVLRRYDAGRPS